MKFEVVLDHAEDILLSLIESVKYLRESYFTLHLSTDLLIFPFDYHLKSTKCLKIQHYKKQ